MIDILYVSIGGFIGAICRFIVAGKLQHKKSFPVGTLTVNLLGSFLIGLLFGMQVKGPLYSLLGIGFLGAFTTFSTFKLESVQLKQKKMSFYFYSYVALSYTMGIGFVLLGIILGKWII